MKLVRYGQPGKEKPGLIDAQGRLRDLSGVVADITPDQLSDKALARLAKLKTDRLPLVRGTPLADADVEGVLAGYVRGIAMLVSVLDAHHAPPGGGNSTSTS